MPESSQKRVDWQAVFILPNIEIRSPIEADALAIVSITDQRLIEICAAHKPVKDLLGKFSDAFGVRRSPSVLIHRAGGDPRTLDLEAISSFRDLVAMSVVTLSTAHILNHRRSFPVPYSDWFEFYPWTIGRDNERLVGRSPAIWGMHEVKSFSGQISPSLFHQAISPSDIDKTLLGVLLSAWRRRYFAASPSWQDVAVFRSLNMAVAAAKMPAIPSGTQFDWGRALSLWVSAFEILAHTRTDTGFKQVYGLLERPIWRSKQCKHRRRRAYMSRNSMTQKSAPLRNLACWIYGELYHARNDFLHGNEIANDRLIVRKTRRLLSDYAAPLYRMAIAAALDFAPREPKSKDLHQILVWQKENFDSLYTHRTFENALSTIGEPDEDDDAPRSKVRKTKQ